MRKPLLIAIMGPTASGKTHVAEALADTLGLQLISADAFMVYRGFDVGTNKPQRKAEYELIDVVDSHEEFGVGEWVRRTVAVLEQLWSEGRGAVVGGGTGFYIRALFEEYRDMKPAPDPRVRKQLEDKLESEGLAALVEELWRIDPDAAQATDLMNPVRVRRAIEKASDTSDPIAFSLPPFQRSKFILDPPADALDVAIETRVALMLRSGWTDEVRRLLQQGVQTTAPAFRAIGYECVVDLIEGRLGEEEAKHRIATATRQYAKRQRTWLRSEPNASVIDVLSLDARGADRAVESILNVFE